MVYDARMADEKDIAAAPTIDAASTDGAGGGMEETQVATLIANRYAILGLLGAGGMGRVYRAHDRTLDEVVALKVLHRSTSSVERFRAEVKLARRVTSPHVVRTFEAGEHGRDQFLTMEFIDGRSLSQLLDDGPPPLDETLRISRAMAAGIATAHAAGVMHRDLKPDNVLIGKDGRVAITDFGIAAPADAGPATAFVGTPAYAAPEQLFGEPISAAVDVFAFGAILYELLTGRPTFTGNDYAQLIATRRAAPPDPRAHREVASTLAELTMQCMARSPNDRFADGAALARALSDVHVANIAKPDEPRPAVPGRTSRSIAILPLRASSGLEEIAGGLAEEIVDALAMTRDLRVRPLASVRAMHSADADPIERGRGLGVDVVIEGTLRPNGDLLRFSARAIGVTDGFLLCSTRFDVRSTALLTVADDLAQKVAAALAIDLALPPRAELGADAMALYLEAKANLRSKWLMGPPEEIVTQLERALALAPNDVGIMSALSMGHSRMAFLNARKEALTRARELAERAVLSAPQDGEAWCALGVASLYEANIAAAAGAFVRAVKRAPGNAMAQAFLGSILLDAGMMDEAMAHLEGAHALDPKNTPLGVSDLSRAYMYIGREHDADALLAAEAPHSLLAVTMQGRFSLWRDRRAEQLEVDLSAVPAGFRNALGLQLSYYRSHVLSPELIDGCFVAHEKTSARFRAANAQFVAEVFAHAGEHARALEFIELGVAAGLQDRQWLTHCPVLEPLRALPRFRELASVVEARAQLALAAVHEAQMAK
jgi:serine/threonine-protein kinase